MADDFVLQALKKNFDTYLLLVRCNRIPLKADADHGFCPSGYPMLRSYGYIVDLSEQL